MAQFTDIPLNKIDRAGYTALSRLQVWFTAQTHAMLWEMSQDLTVALHRAAWRDGVIPFTESRKLAQYSAKKWAIFNEAWQKLFKASRKQAASIPFGSLARYHAYYFKQLSENLTPTLSYIGEGAKLPPDVGGTEGGRPLNEDGLSIGGAVVFDPQRQEILDAVEARVWGDNFNLSQRLWKLDQDSKAGIAATIQAGIAEGESAWDMAQKLEKYLGAGADCPRWAQERLSDLTKSDIAAGDQTGLIKGNPCGSEGVAYNALRLARNEINLAHHAAVDALFKQQPWVTYENINLSPAHPRQDICDDIAGQGPYNGAYQLGTHSLPIHVHCLCYKTAVLMPPDQFATQLKGWASGAAKWPEMDSYADFVGREPQAVSASALNSLAQPMMYWLLNQALEQVLP